MGLISKDAFLRSFNTAFSFHSYRLDTIPILSDDGQVIIKKNTDYRCTEIASSGDRLLGGAILGAVISGVCFIYTQSTGFATLTSACIAVVAALLSIKNTKSLKAVELATNAVSGVFETKLKTLETTTSKSRSKSLWSLSHPISDIVEYHYEKQPKETLQDVLRYSRDLKDPLEKNVFLVMLAFYHDPKLKQTIPETQKHIEFLATVKVAHLTAMLNKIEHMCQSVYAKIYDESIVRDSFGSEMIAIANELLPYIYTRRELHIMRTALQTNSLALYLPSNDNLGPFYTMTEEKHDLLYEYFEYYCYKWYWAPRDNAVGFHLFHSRVQHAYHSCLACIMGAEKDSKELATQRLPYMKSLTDYIG